MKLEPPTPQNSGERRKRKEAETMTTKFPQIPTLERVPAELLLRRSTPAQPWQLATPQPILRVGGMSPYRPTRREFLVGAGSLLVLAPFGCGSDDGAGGETTSSGTRTVEHAAGTTEVPARPQRAVALFGPTLAALVAVGVELAGSTGNEPSGDHGWDSYIPEDEQNELRFAGIQGQPNIERIASLSPDLMLGVSAYEDQNYDELSEIAPTVLFDWAGTTRWKEHFDQVVSAAGREDEGRRDLGDYEDRTESIQRRLDDSRQTEVSYISWYTDGFRVYLDNSFAGSILKDVGLSRPASQVATGDEEAADYVDYSYEEISKVDADVILVAIYDEETRSSFADFQSNPLWENLDAVRRGNVYQVNERFWGSSNYYGAHMVLDDIERYLVGGGSTTGGTTS